MLTRGAHSPAESVGRQIAFIVEDEHVVAARHRKAVVPCRCADVGASRNQLHLGELVADHRRRAVAGGVVDHDDVHPIRRIIGLRQHAVKYLPQLVAAVVDDDDDRHRREIRLGERAHAVVRHGG